MNRKVALIGFVFLAAVLGALLYTSLGHGKVRCEVCITYRDRRACRTAAGSTKEEALRAARDNACALIASGVTDSIACQNTTPDSIRWP
jgi:hypothetical protein